MSVLLSVKMYGDIARFRAALTDRAGEFTKVAEIAKEKGAIHHRFAVDEAAGCIIALDEWESAAQFEEFFGDPTMHEFIASAGADTSRQPEITVYQAQPSPDQF